MTATPAFTNQSRALTSFFLLTFGISWAFWIPAVLGFHGVLPVLLPETLSRLLGAFGPSIAALLVVWRFEGVPGLRSLGHRLRIWRVGIGWYGVALLWPIIQSLLTTAIAIILGNRPPLFSKPPIVTLAVLPPEMRATTPFLAFLPLFFLQQTFVGSSMGEELGWRGYLLPWLHTRMGAFQASLVVGLIWAVWHIPLWLMNQHATQATLLGWTILNLFATSVIFTWLANNTQGSLLLALLFHSSIALTGLFLASIANTALIHALVQWGMVALVLHRYGARTLTRPSTPYVSPSHGEC